MYLGLPSWIEGLVIYATSGACAGRSRVVLRSWAQPAVAVVVYEYLITIDDEVKTVWKRKLNLASAFLLFIRLTMIASAVINFQPLASPSVRLGHRSSET